MYFRKKKKRIFLSTSVMFVCIRKCSNKEEDRKTVAITKYTKYLQENKNGVQKLSDGENLKCFWNLGIVKN